ncbi:MAG: toprim domain-containing protein, partial [Flavobacteriales bacterium]
GIENVVSSSGTALTREQIKLISRYTKNIVILFDCDAAGIKASFRGIDLILEEGLNVKIVLFPQGEDPDSFAKTREKEEIVSFLTESAQDFISFKAGVLLKEVSNDPLQTATAIKDIVASIALIPDSIARSVFTKSIAERYGLEEGVIQQEVLRIRSGKLASQYQEPSLNVDFHAKPVRKIPAQLPVESYTEEREVIRLMLKYGNQQLAVVQEDHTEKVTSAIEIMVHELTEDDIQFYHPIYAQIYRQILEGISEGILYSYKYFLRSEDKGVLDLVGDMIGFEDELSSRWESMYRIRTKHEASDLYQTVMQAIFHLKFVRVAQHIKTLQAKLSDESTTQEEMISIMAEQVAYEKVKKSFSEKLGRIIY